MICWAFMKFLLPIRLVRRMPSVRQLFSFKQMESAALSVSGSENIGKDLSFFACQKGAFLYHSGKKGSQ